MLRTKSCVVTKAGRTISAVAPKTLGSSSISRGPGLQLDPRGVSFGAYFQ
jgi:hypothetical protein